MLILPLLTNTLVKRPIFAICAVSSNMHERSYPSKQMKTRVTGRQSRTPSPSYKNNTINPSQREVISVPAHLQTLRGHLADVTRSYSKKLWTILPRRLMDGCGLYCFRKHRYLVSIYNCYECSDHNRCYDQLKHRLKTKSITLQLPFCI